MVLARIAPISTNAPKDWDDVFGMCLRLTERIGHIGRIRVALARLKEIGWGDKMEKVT
jgi:hypothetical protein